MKIYLGALLLTLGSTPLALAQDAPKPAAKQPAAKPLSSVALTLGKTYGQTILLDTLLTMEKTTFVAKTDASEETLEETLTKLVKTLPAGAAWAKVYLPEPPPGKKYTGDAVARYVMAQATLFGKAGESKPGKIELLGKQVPDAEAEPMVAGLKLKPYYVLSSPARRFAGAGAGPLGGMLKNGASDIMGPLLKQLGVSDPKDIPPGSYKISIPGPDGTMMDGNVNVMDDGNGNRAVAISIGKPGGGQ